MPALLVRGMIAGLVAGLLVFAFGRLAGEPQVDRAIAFEAALDETRARGAQAHGMPAMDETELVSRPVQAGWGLLIGVVVYATAFGGLFALVFAATHRRAVALGPRGTAALLAALAFVSVYLVPSLKYPANPPSVGQADTIGFRTALYFSMIALSVTAMVMAALLRARLVARYGGWTAAIAAMGFYVLAMVLAGRVMPPINEVPEAFPAEILWRFRVASTGMQVVMWATLGLLFGALTERTLVGGRRGNRQGWIAT